MTVSETTPSHIGAYWPYHARECPARTNWTADNCTCGGLAQPLHDDRPAGPITAPGTGHLSELSRRQLGVNLAVIEERAKIIALAVDHSAICVCRCGMDSAAPPGHPRKFADLITEKSNG